MVGPMAILQGESISRADLAWLHAEDVTNHFVVTSLALLDAPIDVERFKAMLARRMALHPRLRQVVGGQLLPLLPLLPPRWTAAANFDLDAHVHRAALPAPGGKEELAAFVGDLAGRPLDLERPLWDIYAVEGFGTGGALVGRFHHSLGDGQAMVRMLLTLTDETAGGWKKPAARVRSARRGVRRSGRTTQLLDALNALPELGRQAFEGAGTLAKLTLMTPDQPTPLRGELSLLKAVDWTEPVPLPLVKRIAKASGTTINDVVVSAIAGGIGSYLRRAKIDTRGMRIRAMVPVNLRPPDDTGMTGNRFSLVYLELPVGVAGAWERLMRVKIEMDRIKASMEPAVGWLLVQSLGLLPVNLEHMASSFYAGKASLVLTNVIGPKQPLFMAGVPIRQMTFWEPESGGLGVGISIYSYANEITIGVISDKNLVPEPRAITSAVMKSFADLERETPGV
jgi:diacylglycerol O-acyltransferase / wax synthase